MNRNATIKDRTLKQALERARKVEDDLPHIIQVLPSDWDIVILAKRVHELEKRINNLKSKQRQ